MNTFNKILAVVFLASMAYMINSVSVSLVSKVEATKTEALNIAYDMQYNK